MSSITAVVPMVIVRLFVGFGNTETPVEKSKFAFLIPEAEFIHFHGASTGKSLAIKKELKISLLYIIRKHYGFLGHFTVSSFLTVKYLFSSIFKPKNWPLFYLLLIGTPLSKSLKMKQKIVSNSTI